MKYTCNNSNWNDVARHLRNKNLAIYYESSNPIQGIFNRLSSVISRCCIKIGRKKLVVSEQIIENPLVFRNLRENDRTILDFGGFESIMPLQLSALGYKVTVLDQRRYPFCHPNLNVYGLDLFSDSFKIKEKFDVIISISTIEHLGIAAYGDSKVENADKRGVEILLSMLEEGGRLMASVPVGKPSIQRGYRVYNEQRVV
jgi:hypothetical protein